MKIYLRYRYILYCIFVCYICCKHGFSDRYYNYYTKMKHFIYFLSLYNNSIFIFNFLKLDIKSINNLIKNNYKNLFTVPLNMILYLQTWP